MAEVLIIGGGVSGLSAGIYAQLNSLHATICEKQNTTGGNLTGWQRGKYHIDNCIHWLTGTNPNSNYYQIWKDLGALGNVKIYYADTLYTYEENGVQLSLYNDIDKIAKELLELSPDDKKEIQSLIKAVKILQKVCGISEKQSAVKAEALRELLAAPALYKYFRMSTGTLSKRFKNPIIQGFITSMLGHDFSALALLIVFATFCGKNGGIPQGSSVGTAKRITERFLALGGKLLLNKEAVAIQETETGKQLVCFSDGTMITADYVVIATEPPMAFKKLLNLPLPNTFLKQYSNPKMPRFSSFQCAFACEESDLPFRNDFIFKLPKAEQKKLHTENLILREFSHETTFAPKGCNIIQTLTFCNEKDCIDFIKLRDNTEKYKAKKMDIAQTIQGAIEKKFPPLQGKLRCIDVWTPATYHRYTNAETGAYMGFLFPPKMLPKRLNNIIKQRPNVVLATQWLQAPGGLPIAASVGKNAVEKILKRERQNKRRRRNIP